MARIRSIKPEFFRDEKLGDLPAVARLLFAGLWTQADCAGRLKDSPRRLKVELLPYDDCDVDQLLGKLEAAGFIVRYEGDGERLIQVVNFLKHQRISGKEAAGKSEYPAPPRTVKQRGSNGEAPEKQLSSDGAAAVALEGKGREGKGKEEAGAASADADSAAPVDQQEAASPKPQKPTRQRAPSAQERLAERLRAIRAEAHPEWPGDLQILAQPALNLQLAKVAKAAGGEDGAAELWRHYLADPWAQKRDPPCPLAAFLADGVWSKYLGRSSPAARPRCCVPGCTAEAEERLGLWRGNGCREHFEAWNAERKRAFEAGVRNMDGQFEAWMQAQLPRQEAAQA